MKVKKKKKEIVSVAQGGSRGTAQGPFLQVDRGQVQRRKWARSTLATAGKAVAFITERWAEIDRLIRGRTARSVLSITCSVQTAKDQVFIDAILY
jgi:hypothetical protein